MTEKNPAAVELGRRGGLARKDVLSAKRRKEIAVKASKAAAKARTQKAKTRRGGKARARGLTGEQRKVNARLAAQARWAKVRKRAGTARGPQSPAETRGPLVR